MASVKSVKIRHRTRRFPPAGRARTHRLDLELLSWAALMWSYRCPSSAPHSPLFSLHLCLKTRFSTTISPLYLCPIHRNAHICLKMVFFYDQLLGADRCLARFLSSIHEEERTIADVNTGNDTNKTENKPKLLA